MDEKQKAIKGIAKVIESELGIFFGAGDIVESEDFPYQAEGIAETLVNACYGDLTAFAKALNAKVEGDINRVYMLGSGAVGPLCHFKDQIDETLKEFLGGEK